MTQTHTRTQQITDHELKSSVTEELSWASNVNADNVGVSVNSGAITLSGQVNTYPEKSAAVAATLRVAGVTSVADEIVVWSHQAARDDTGIAAHARQALERSSSVPRTVQAIVHDHQVTLTGTVPWNYQRNVAGRMMENLPGVHSVQNDIKIVPQLPFAADSAKLNIRAALVRNAQVEADHIHVHTNGTEIELTGTVQTWAERSQAGHIAWNTPGVTKVHNNLHIAR
ncbi:ornithine aminotransferase [Flexivirga endophytica]|uniref:Ornithine aminotransferase n=1 Tax=Flexivirga endophytica TaxID=1849103 RepID=A0A916WW78_9MICO|nr:BON domain-containing protein [Flexivirga endophytica]GGB34770.1 ornithine aminotransferase [Flexivirga endophytica]